MPEETTKVAVVVVVGVGQTGRTIVEVRPSEITIVVDCARAELRKAAMSRRVEGMNCILAELA